MPKQEVIHILTEREWRKQSSRMRQAVPSYWGAQYILSKQKKKTVLHQRRFHVWMLFTSFGIALLLPCVFPKVQIHYFPEVIQTSTTLDDRVRKVSAIDYQMPFDQPCSLHAFTNDQLLRGKLLLLDDAHPLPLFAPLPRTQSILHYSSGTVPVSDLTLQSGSETISALQSLFLGLQTNGLSGLTVQTGTMTTAQREALTLRSFQTYASTLPLSEALALTWQNASYGEEFEQAYTVEIRLTSTYYSPASAQAVSQSKQHWYLLQNAWRHGFVLRYIHDDCYCFRYVGKAHATAMTYLNLSLEEYLLFLHVHPIVTISPNGTPLYIIQCAEMIDSHIGFSIPDHASTETSLDNMGYAIVASTLPSSP